MAPPLSREPTAALVLADGTAFAGHGFGAPGVTIGEVVFNTAMTGYQEILTDPSYAGQMVAFTFPHVGNVGANDEDVEATTPAARGVVLRAAITQPSNWRSLQHLARWLESHGLRGIGGVDTRRLTRALRDGGAQNAALAYAPDGRLDIADLRARAKACPSLEGLDLSKDVTVAQRASWDQTLWRPGEGYGRGDATGPHVVAIDYGCKRNILRYLAERGCKITVVPAETDAEAVLVLAPDGLLLTNGPGDPAATARHAAPTIRKLVDHGVPTFGICLGHQLLALAMGGRTEKMKFGHHGANHPVKELATGKVSITSQNHGFAVSAEDLPDGVEATHVSLFDGTLQGLRLKDRPAFSVQYHPEASPGPQDSEALFDRFVAMMRR